MERSLTNGLTFFVDPFLVESEGKVGLFEWLTSLCRCGTIKLINVKLLDVHSAISAQLFLLWGEIVGLARSILYSV